MLRRLISTSVEENWNSLDEQIKNTLKAELLLAVQQENDQFLSIRFCLFLSGSFEGFPSMPSFSKRKDMP